VTRLGGREGRRKGGVGREEERRGGVDGGDGDRRKEEDAMRMWTVNRIE